MKNKEDGRGVGRARVSTVHGVKWTAIEKFSLQGIQAVIGLVLARLLAPSDFGVVGMMTIFISISQTFVDGGFGNALVRKRDLTDRDCSTAFYWCVALGALCYVVLYVISGRLALFFNTPALRGLLRVFAIAMFINSLCIVQVAKLTWAIDFKSQAIATVVSIVPSGAVGIYLAWRGLGAWALVWQTVVSAAVKMIIIWFEARWIPLPVFSWESFREMFSYGGKLLMSNLIGTLYNNMSTFLVGKFYSSEALGYYTRGSNFASLPSETLQSILGRVSFPILSKIADDDVRLVGVYRKYIRLSSSLVVFVLMLSVAVGKPLIVVLLGEKWLESVVVFQLLGISMLVNHINVFSLSLLQAKGRSDLYLRLEIVKRVVSLGMLLTALPFGVRWICVSRVVYSLFAVTVNTYYTRKLFRLSIAAQAGDFGRYFIVSLLVCIPSYVLASVDIMPAWGSLTSGVVLSCVLYYVVLRMAKDRSLSECMEILKGRKG